MVEGYVAESNGKGLVVNGVPLKNQGVIQVQQRRKWITTTCRKDDLGWHIILNGKRVLLRGLKVRISE
jgi:hypothetical protein